MTAAQNETVVFQIPPPPQALAIFSGSFKFDTSCGSFYRMMRNYILLDYIYQGTDMVLNTDCDGVLGIYNADFNIASSIDIEIEKLPF